MKKLALLICLITSVALGQEMPNNVPQLSSPVNNAHFEIVASRWMRREIFRLDRYSGRIWQLVVSGEGDAKTTFWQDMREENIPFLSSSNHPHFQIFLSGEFVADTFLIDTDSGSIWRMVEATKKSPEGEIKYLLWEKMGEENGALLTPLPQPSKRVPQTSTAKP